MYYPVSDEALEALVCLFKRFVFPEKTTIIHAGKQDRKVYFIEKGITRSFVLHNGKQITTWFSKEGDAACGSWDLYRNKAGFEYVETLEETTAYSVSIVQLNCIGLTLTLQIGCGCYSKKTSFACKTYISAD